MPVALFFPVKKMFKDYASIAFRQRNLQTLRLSNLDYQTYVLKGKDEVKIADTYFDIERIMFKNDSVVLTVYRDHKETILFDAIAKLFGKKNGDKQKSNPLLQKVFDSYTLLEMPTFAFFQSRIESHFYTHFQLFLSCPLTVFSPPPEFNLV